MFDAVLDLLPPGSKLIEEDIKWARIGMFSPMEPCPWKSWMSASYASSVMSRHDFRESFDCKVADAFLAALCDHALGSVCYPHRQPIQWAATTEFKLNDLAPVTAGKASAEAEIVSMTRTTAVVRIEVRRDDRVPASLKGRSSFETPSRPNMALGI
jgi:hypothetical protein